MTRRAQGGGTLYLYPYHPTFGPSCGLFSNLLRHPVRYVMHRVIGKLPLEEEEDDQKKVLSQVALTFLAKQSAYLP